MSGFLAVALICAATLSPEQCTRATALDVMVRPVASPFECAQQGQVLAASTGNLTPATFLRVDCERRAVLAAPTE